MLPSSPLPQAYVHNRRITFNITAPSHANSDLLSLEVPQDTTISTLKESLQAESRIPKNSQHIYHNGNLLADESKTLEELQIVDGDMLLLHVRDMSVRQAGAPATGTSASRPRQAAPQQQSSSSSGDAETLRLQVLGDPILRQQISATNPALANAIDDSAAFGRQYQLLRDGEEQHKRQVAEQIARLNADPFDLEAQTRIEEMIREERVQENLQNAIEHNPEGRKCRVWYWVQC